MTMPGSPQLSICIPTYRRGAKAKRTATLFARQIIEAKLESSVEIFIGDNASPDDTGELIKSVMQEFPQVQVRYQRHPVNLGGCQNMLTLFCTALGDYVWLFSDDDVPFPGSVGRVSATLKEYAPAVLLFSFIQPPGSTKRLFDFPEKVHLARTPSEMVKLLRQDSKMSSHVYRRMALTEEARRQATALLQECPLFGYWTLPLHVLAANPELPMAIVSEPLAGCDEDFVECLNWDAPDWKAEARVFEHPYVKEGAPEIYRDREWWSYVMAFQFFWMWRIGELGIAERMEPQWWEALGRYPIRWRWALPRVGMLARLIALKAWPARLPRMLAGIARYIRGGGT